MKLCLPCLNILYNMHLAQFQNLHIKRDELFAQLPNDGVGVGMKQDSKFVVLWLQLWTPRALQWRWRPWMLFILWMCCSFVGKISQTWLFLSILHQHWLFLWCKIDLTQHWFLPLQWRSSVGPKARGGTMGPSVGPLVLRHNCLYKTCFLLGEEAHFH